MRELFDRGDHSGATTAILQGYGRELYGFLRAIHRDEDEADEVFAEVAEKLWSGLSRFAWESSARTWAYAISWHVSRTRLRNIARRQRRVVQRGDSFFAGVVAEVRTETSPFLRTERRTRLQALRDSLPEQDRSLLLLRVDRGLGWKELVRVMSETNLDETEIGREAARLRKRFQIVKDRLREMARRDGLTSKT